MRVCRKIFFSLLSVILILALCASVAATEREKPFTLRVGYWPGYGVLEDANGKLSGYSYDYMQKIARINHWEIAFLPCEWAQGLDMLENGELDTFGPMQKTPEREELFDFHELRMGYEYGVVYANENNTDIFYNDAASIDGKTLGTVDDNYYTKKMLEYCRANGISIQLDVMDDVEEIGRALADGTVDLSVMGSLVSSPDTKVVLRLNTEDFFFPTTKGNRVVLEGFNRALDQIRREEPYYDAELYYNHYTLVAAQKTAFTREEQELIDHMPVLRVGYETTNNPLEYFDKESQGAQGITIDLLREVAQYSGLRFEFVPTNSLEHTQSMLASGEIQLVSGMVGDEDFAASYHMNLTKPLLKNTLVFITKQGADLWQKETLLALPEKSVGIRHHMEENYPQFAIVTMPDTRACLDAVLAGKADLAVLNTLSSGTYLSRQRYRGLIANSMTYGSLPICIGMAEGESPLLRDVLNKAIAAVSNDTHKQIIYQHTISVPYEATPTEIIRYSTPFIYCAVAVLFLTLYLTGLHTRQVLNKEAYVDPLTGEMNLNKFKLEAQRLIGSRKTRALMALDIDKFKSVNDLYGYAFGDEVIAMMAKVLRSSIPSGSMLCHGAADKFYLLFEFAEAERITEEFDRIVVAFHKAIEENGVGCNLVLSCGVCMIQPTDYNIVSIIDRANIAAQQVKSYHESRFALYDPSMYARLNQVRTLENHMVEALKNHEFVVYLQPKINISDYRIAGAEALVRWRHPEMGLVAPSEFIPLFENNGFIVNLDFYMLEEVCRLLDRWKQEGKPMFPISVNLSRRHLFNTDTARQLRALVSRYDVEPRLIEVELTESAFDNCNVATMNELFDELHDYGFTVSVDDFGAGYSSLSLLKDLPIDVLKIDKSFFDCPHGCSTDKMGILLESIISLSRKLGIRTLSEGVETKQQVNLLLQLGCDLVQGFYFARPMPCEELEERLEMGDSFRKEEQGTSPL